MRKNVSAVRYRFISEFARAGWEGGDWKAVMSCRKSFEYYEASRGIGLGWWNISPLSRAGYRKLLERCNIKLASVASNVLGVSGTGYAAWPVQTDGVQKAERRLHQPTSVEAPSRTCHKALLATIKKVAPSHIPVFYSMTRQSQVPARRASAAAHGTVSSLRLLRRGRGPLQFR